MGVVGRLDQYASMLAWEFDETTANNPRITGLGTYYASEFSENVGIATTMTANVFPPYDLVYDDFGGTLFGAGQGRYMRQNTDKSVIVYNEIDEVTDFYGRGIVRDGLVLDLDAGKTDSYLYSSRLDSYSSFLVLAIPMDGANNGTTFTDESANIKGSGSAKAITRNGDSKTLTAQSKFYGSSGFFDGNGDTLSLASSTDFEFGTGNFTIEAWVNASSFGNGFVIYSHWNGAGLTPRFTLGFNNTGPGIDSSNGGLGLSFSGSASAVTGTWYHVACVRNGSTFTLYQNGTSVYTATSSATYTPTGYPVNIGDYVDNFGTGSGYMQDLRIYKGVAKYTGNFTPPSTTSGVTVAAATGALPIFNTTDAYGTVKSGSGTTWTDLSPYGNNGTLTNGPTYSSANGGSLVFDGTNDYVLVSSNASIPYGSTARTVSIWFYTNTTTWANDVNNLFYYGAGSNGASFGIDFSTYPSMEVYTYGGAGRDLTFSTTYSQVGWKNINVTYNGSTTILIYENGTFTQTLTLSSACNTPSSGVYIGAINPSVIAGGYYDGRISTTQIYNRALSAAEVSQNFNALRDRYGLSAQPVATVTGSTTSVNEGSSVTFSVASNQFASTLYWTINAVSGTVNLYDFGGAASGSFSTNGAGSGSVALTLANDGLVEGTESFQLQVRTGSTSGTIIATSPTVTINDTSAAPYVTPSTTNIDEGSSVRFDVTSGISSTTLYWTLSTISGTINTSDFVGASVSGSFSTDGSGVGSVALTLANDVTTEGTESFQLQVRTGSTSGTIIATSPTVTINDTSISPLLYAFTSFTFTHGNWAQYPIGNGANPRQTNQSSASTGDNLATFLSLYNTSTYPWLNNTAYYNVTTLGFQQWTAPITGTYRITVAGAAGGSHPAKSAGSGAIITADVSLTQGVVYTVLVGKRGENTTNLSTTNCGAGGGGGSFFFINASDATPIIAAGGGGGACLQKQGVNASLTTSGANGNGVDITGGAVGGVNGGIPTVNSGNGDYDAGGGAGWLSGNGEINSNANDASFGYAPRNSGRGGFRSADGTDDWGGHGGFGGGGGGTTEYGNAGGGGGYSGGGKGCNTFVAITDFGGGGGGGSFYTGTLVSSSASNTGQGYVIIQIV